MTEKKSPASFQISQKAVIYDPIQKKFLLVKYDQVEDKKNRGRWGFIGGRIDENESAEDALKREIFEEAGNIEFINHGVIAFDIDSRCRVGYLIEYVGGEISLSKEHSEFIWKTVEEIEQERNCHPSLIEFIKGAMRYIENKEYLNDLKRLQADFENYKKRQIESQKDLRGILTEKLILDIVPVLDNFRSATQHVPPEEKESPWVVGIQYIEKQLETVLTDNGVQMIEVKEGDVFDPSIHEALEMENGNIKMENEEKEVEDPELDEGKEPHVIAKVVQKGYKFGDRVIRPAKVIVK
jgi:molecular chaperone GrpE